MALIYTPPPELGKTIPSFSLPNVDGSIFSSSTIQKNSPVVIMFICNHCPYVKAIEDRLIQLGLDLNKIDIPLIGISSNDASHYPEDSFENMKKRAIEKNYSFQYLYDESQSVAKDFGAVCTPDFFVYDKNHQLSYRGRLDDNWKEPHSVKHRELYEVVKILSGKSRDGDSHRESNLKNQIPSMGCSLKWKK